jgi:hypothetical protein
MNELTRYLVKSIILPVFDFGVCCFFVLECQFFFRMFAALVCSIFGLRVHFIKYFIKKIYGVVNYWLLTGKLKFDCQVVGNSDW